MKVEHDPHAKSKFRILSSNDAHETSEITEIFRNSVKTSHTPTTTSSLTTSVNTTILGGVNAVKNSQEDCNILNPSFQNDSSYEKSIEKGIIRNQVSIHINLKYLNCACIRILESFEPQSGSK